MSSVAEATWLEGAAAATKRNNPARKALPESRPNIESASEARKGHAEGRAQFVLRTHDSTLLTLSGRPQSAKIIEEASEGRLKKRAVAR